MGKLFSRGNKARREEIDWSNAIVCADQARDRLTVLKAHSDWSRSENLLWQWESGLAPELSEEQKKWFLCITECKFIPQEKLFLITASNGAVALLEIPSKKIVFLAFAAGNTHSAELLPDGNIIAAASTGNGLTLFTRPGSGQRISPERIVSRTYPFPHAHGCVWDRAQNLLWVLGGGTLAAFQYHSGPEVPALQLRDSYDLSSVSPLLSPDIQRMIETPDEGEDPEKPAILFYGHDLFPVPGSRILYATGRSAVLCFDTVSRTFQLEYSCRHVKSISRDPRTGEVILLIPEESWWSSKVSFSGGEKADLPGARFYKARWCVPNEFSYGV